VCSGDPFFFFAFIGTSHASSCSAEPVLDPRQEFSEFS
jgi:hypothetical protein